MQGSKLKRSLFVAVSGSLCWRNQHLRHGYRDDKNRIVQQIVRNTQGHPELQFWFRTGMLDKHADRNKNSISDPMDDTVDLTKGLKAKGYKRSDEISYPEVIGGRHNVPTRATAMA